jgi:hypothetical protein
MRSSALAELFGHEDRCYDVSFPNISANDPNTVQLKEYIVHIFFGNDNRILIALLPLVSVWACGARSRASVASNKNAPCPKPRAGKRIERMKGTAEYLSAG